MKRRPDFPDVTFLLYTWLIKGKHPFKWELSNTGRERWAERGFTERTVGTPRITGSVGGTRHRPNQQGKLPRPAAAAVELTAGEAESARSPLPGAPVVGRQAGPPSKLGKWGLSSETVWMPCRMNNVSKQQGDSMLIGT